MVRKEDYRNMTAMTLPALPPVSSLEAYVQAVNAIPMLTQERETELARRDATATAVADRSRIDS